MKKDINNKLKSRDDRLIVKSCFRCAELRHPARQGSLNRAIARSCDRAFRFKVPRGNDFSIRISPQTGDFYKAGVIKDKNSVCQMTEHVSQI